MGCGGSSEAGTKKRKKQKQRAANQDQQQGIELQISQPRSMRMVPQQTRDASGRPVQPQYYDLTKDILQTALATAANYIARRKREITIITVGGAVNTMLLQTRDTTHDLDFFTAEAASSDLSLIDQAQQEAQARSSVPLGGDWMNNSTILFMPQELRRQLVQEAIRQNEVVFRAAGLCVLAAPWHYALCTKLDRMSKPTRRAYDPQDAAVYLHRFIRRNQVQGVRVATLRAWSQQFGTQAPDAVIQELGSTYQAMYREPSPIVA